MPCVLAEIVEDAITILHGFKICFVLQHILIRKSSAYSTRLIPFPAETLNNVLKKIPNKRRTTKMSWGKYYKQLQKMKVGSTNLNGPTR